MPVAPPTTMIGRCPASWNRLSKIVGTRLPRWRLEVGAKTGVVAVGVAEQTADVEQRRAGARRFPIDHAADRPALRALHDQVASAEIAVYEANVAPRHSPRISIESAAREIGELVS